MMRGAGLGLAAAAAASCGAAGAGLAIGGAGDAAAAPAAVGLEVCPAPAGEGCPPALLPDGLGLPLLPVLLPPLGMVSCPGMAPTATMPCKVAHACLAVDGMTLWQESQEGAQACLWQVLHYRPPALLLIVARAPAARVAGGLRGVTRPCRAGATLSPCACLMESHPKVQSPGEARSWAHLAHIQLCCRRTAKRQPLGGGGTASWLCLLASLLYLQYVATFTHTKPCWRAKKLLGSSLSCDILFYTLQDSSFPACERSLPLVVQNEIV